MKVLCIPMLDFNRQEDGSKSWLEGFIIYHFKAFSRTNARIYKEKIYLCNALIPSQIHPTANTCTDVFPSSLGAEIP